MPTKNDDNTLIVIDDDLLTETAREATKQSAEKLAEASLPKLNRHTRRKILALARREKKRATQSPA